MKKFIFIISVLLLVVGCETKYYSVLITNDSSKAVSYTYNASRDTLEPEKSKIYEVEVYTPPPTNIIDEDGIASVKMERKGDEFTFIDYNYNDDKLPLVLNIMNTLPVEVKRIKADNYISFNKGFIIPSIPTNGSITSDLYIYTNKPKFSLEADSDGITEPSYPIIFNWIITENPISKKEEMYLTIR